MDSKGPQARTGLAQISCLQLLSLTVEKDSPMPLLVWFSMSL